VNGEESVEEYFDWMGWSSLLLRRVGSIFYCLVMILKVYKKKKKYEGEVFDLVCNNVVYLAFEVVDFQIL
jgi:hypothetical protein